jgi:hypothetical protein
MSMLHGARREIQRLRRKLVEDERDFRAAAPPLDEDGLPRWDGPGVPLEGYERACGGAPDEELTPEELEVRDRLSPYIEVFANLDKPSGGAP